MREPVTPYAHINFKLHILKRMTLKMKLRVVTGLGVMANKWRIRITIVLKAIASKVMKLKLRIHLDCRNQLLDTKGKFKQYLGPNSMFWTLSSTSSTLKLFFAYFSTLFFFFFSTLLFFSTSIITHTSPTLVFCHTLIKRNSIWIMLYYASRTRVWMVLN